MLECLEARNETLILVLSEIARANFKLEANLHVQLEQHGNRNST